MILEEYSVNSDTLILEPAHTVNYDTIVIEKNRIYYVRQTPMQIIKKACLFNWTTYEGCRQAVMKNTSFKKKVPVLINREYHICAFPTHAPGHFECSWIFCDHIVRITKNNTGSILTLDNGMSIEVPVSQFVIKKQYERALSCMINQYDQYHLYSS